MTTRCSRWRACPADGVLAFLSCIIANAKPPVKREHLPFSVDERAVLSRSEIVRTGLGFQQYRQDSHTLLRTPAGFWRESLCQGMVSLVPSFSHTYSAHMNSRQDLPDVHIFRLLMPDRDRCFHRSLWNWTDVSHEVAISHLAIRGHFPSSCREEDNLVSFAPLVYGRLMRASTSRCPVHALRASPSLLLVLFDTSLSISRCI